MFTIQELQERLIRIFESLHLELYGGPLEYQTDDLGIRLSPQSLSKVRDIFLQVLHPLIRSGLHLEEIARPEESFTLTLLFPLRSITQGKSYEYELASSREGIFFLSDTSRRIKLYLAYRLFHLSIFHAWSKDQDSKLYWRATLGTDPQGGIKDVIVYSPHDIPLVDQALPHYLLHREKISLYHYNSIASDHMVDILYQLDKDPKILKYLQEDKDKLTFFFSRTRILELSEHVSLKVHSGFSFGFSLLD
ncbi:MAG: hypothetical protein QXM12_07105 [Nitrososphaerota archaeon]